MTSPLSKSTAAMLLLLTATLTTPSVANAAIVVQSRIDAIASIYCKKRHTATTFTSPPRIAHDLQLTTVHWYTDADNRANTLLHDITVLHETDRIDREAVFTLPWTARASHMQTNHYATFCNGGLLLEFERESSDDDDC